MVTNIEDNVLYWAYHGKNEVTIVVAIELDYISLVEIYI